MNRFWIAAMGLLGFAALMGMRGLATSVFARAAISAAAFAWAAIAVVWFTRFAQRR